MDHIGIDVHKSSDGGYGAVAEHQKLLSETRDVCEGTTDQVRQAKADFTLVRSCPHKSMAPVSAIAELVADRRCRTTAIVTPLERFIYPSQPGRAWSLPPRGGPTWHPRGNHR